MTKKIAIYGDSFAASLDWWPRLLSKLPEFENYKIFAFGIGGTGPDYSYSRFLETHENYDKVIFLWSSDLRSTLITLEEGREHVRHITFHYHPKLKDTYEQAIQIARNNRFVFNQINKDSLRWVKNEWIYIQKYQNKNTLFNIAMRDSVKLVRPDSINIECFDFLGKSGLFNVQKKDMEQYSEFILEENLEIRKNHLSFRQSVEFVKYLYKHINDENFDIHDTFEFPEKYYTMSKTIEESGYILK